LAAVRRKSIARNAGILIMLGPEHGLVLMIKPDANALSPPNDIYCLLRVPTTYPGLLDFAARSKKYLKHRLLLPQPIAFAPATLCLSTTTRLSSGPELMMAEVVHFTHPIIPSCREHSTLKVKGVQRILWGIGSRLVDSKLAMESCMRTTGIFELMR